MSLTYTVGVVLLVSAALLLSLVVLAQKSRAAGLFSNSGVIGTAAKPSATTTWATSVLFGVFLTLTVVLNLLSH